MYLQHTYCCNTRRLMLNLFALGFFLWQENVWASHRPEKGKYVSVFTDIYFVGIQIIITMGRKNSSVCNVAW